MKFDTAYLGPQELTADDRSYTGSRFADVRAALFRSTYYLTWGAAGEPPLPVYAVSLGRVLKGILSRRGGWSLLQAAGRALDSPADLRPGPDGRGYRRLLHPNGVCLFGRWIIDQPTPYSGYFRQGKEALIIGRYSTCCTETRSGRYRSLSLVGKLYPTTDPEHCEPLQTANFITQEDIGGRRTSCINDAVLRSTPDTTPWRRGLGLPILLLTGLAFLRSDRQPTARQLYPIAELGKPDSEPTRTPMFMQLKVSEGQARIEEDSLDFREEILRHIYGAGNQTAPRLTFDIEVTDRAVTRGRLVQRRSFPDGWKRIGRIEFDEAVVSYDGDFVIHFQHPPWRDNPNDPNTIHRNRAGAAPRSE
jgi:hypothetical protein